jgi:hypothetical protein
MAARQEFAAILRDASLRDALRTRLMVCVDVFFVPMHYRQSEAMACLEALG